MVAQATPLVEYDMQDHQMIDHRPTPDAQDALWRACVVDVAARAAQTLPESAGRIDLAQKLVLDGAVTFQPDGSALVKSQSGKETTHWHVNGACACPDVSRAPDGWCKHKLARAICQRARTALAMRLQAQRPVQETKAMVETPQTPAVASGTVVSSQSSPTTSPTDNRQLPEAPASANVYVTIDGNRVQITLRDTDETRLIARMRKVMAQYPAPQESASDASRAQTPAGPPPCPRHGAAKVKRSKFKGF